MPSFSKKTEINFYTMKKFYSLFIAILFLSIVSCSSDKDAEVKNEENDSTNVDSAKVEVVDTIKTHGKIEFSAPDGLTITADSYEVMPGEKYVLLCHQAGSSRGEFVDIAKKLNVLGYNCLAIDQRSGEKCNNIINQTALKAKEKKLKTDYLDAQQDIEAAIDYIFGHSGKKIIVVGSSYSAGLVLKMAKASSKISAIALFSPGEYFDGINLQKECSGLTVPLFATSSKEETKDLKTLLEGIKNDYKTIFEPKSKGEHGCMAMWPDSPCKDEYWNAFQAFLEKIK